MKVRQVVFRKTKQVSRFEPETIELTIELTSQKDTVEEAVARARATCDALLGNIPSEEEVEQARLILAQTSLPKFR